MFHVSPNLLHSDKKQSTVVLAYPTWISKPIIFLRRVPSFCLKGLLYMMAISQIQDLLCLNWTQQAQGKRFQLTHYSSSWSICAQLATNAQLISSVFMCSLGLCLSHNRETKEIQHPLPLEAVSNVNLCYRKLLTHAKYSTSSEWVQSFQMLFFSLFFSRKCSFLVYRTKSSLKSWWLGTVHTNAYTHLKVCLGKMPA